MAAPDPSLMQLRVQDGDTQHVYRGVSANTWLTPIGLAVYKPGTLAPRGSQLPVPCVQSLQQRARSANAILGRRHFETEQQGLNPDEGITGKRISSQGLQGEQREDEEDERELNLRAKVKIPLPPFMYNGVERHINGLERPKTRIEERACFIPRPYTSVGEHRTGYKRADLMECPAFMVQPLQTPSNKKRDVGRCKSAMVSQETLNFKAVKYSLDQKLMDKTHKRPESRYNKSDKSRPEVGVGRGRLRSAWPSLRPLLYDEELAATSCTSSCHGCFKACLASDDFFDKHQQEYKVKKKPQTPKLHLHKRPIRQIQREYPDLQYLMLAKANQESAP